MDVLLLIVTLLTDGRPCAMARTETGQEIAVQGLPEAAGTGTRYALTGQFRQSRACQRLAFVVTKAEPVPE
jgi:hypothetical protein